jgi:hypothetical protein
MGLDPRWLGRLAPWAWLGAGCGPLLGLTDDYQLAPDGSVEAPPSDEDAGSAEAGPDSSAPDTGVPDAGPFAMPAGKLVFHRYTSYATGDSEMYVVDFPSGERSEELGALYGLCNPLSGIFSPDGTKLVVGAQSRSEPCPPTDVLALELYILDLAQPGMKQQITMNALEDQDPQFSFAGDFVVFKHNGHVAEWPLGAATFTTCDALPEGAHCYASPVEQSKPVITPDDATICMYEGHFDESDVYCFDRLAARSQGVEAVKKPAAVHRGVNDYRPTVDETHLYYVRGWSMVDQVTYIARTPLSNLSAVSEMAPFCSDMTANYDDPCTLGDDLLVFSSDKPSRGGRDLFVADYAGTFTHALDEFSPGLNSGKHETGPDFWRAPP